MNELCVPACCADGGAALAAVAGPDDPADERRQVTDLPPLAATVTEYRLAARRCHQCGTVTRARPVGAALLAIEAAVFRHWHRFRVGELDRAELWVALEPVQAAMVQVLADGAAQGHAVARPRCRHLQTLWPALWTFAQVDGVAPTNTAAEQALRPAVLWRKGSFGTHSPAGSRFVERMLTVAASCRQQQRSLFDLLVAAVIAHRTGTPPPSLLAAPAA